MKNLRIIIFIFITNINNAQTVNINFNGKVKLVKEVEFALKVKFGEVVKDEIKSIQILKYDSNGNLIEKSINSLGFSFLYKYKYNQNDNIIEETRFAVNNQDEKGLSTIIFNYDENQKIISKESLNEKIIYKYDSNGNQKEEDIISNGIFKYRTIFMHDNVGNLLERSVYNSEGQFIYKYEFKYDKKRFIIEEKNFNSDFKLVSKNNYKYDSNGNLIKKNTYLGGSVQSEKKFIYKYDEYDNWIEKIEFESARQKKFTEREIQYY